jgi:hypothetical protein
MPAAAHLALPPLTAEQADAVLGVLDALEQAIWAAHEPELTQLAIRQERDAQHELDEARSIEPDYDDSDDLPY